VSKPTFAVVTGATVHSIVFGDVGQCMDTVHNAYITYGVGQSVNPHSLFLRPIGQPTSRIIALPAYLGSTPPIAGIKWISSFPENVSRGLPRASAVLILNDLETGYPYACLEASIISAARTAASTVIAAHAVSLVSNRPFHTIGIVGNGLIARYIYEFFTAFGWRFDHVHLHDIAPGKSWQFADDLGIIPNVTVHEGSVEPLLKKSDLIVFATTASEPYLNDPYFFSHNPIVLNISLRDLGTDIISSSYNVVDDIEHVLRADTSMYLTEKLLGHREFINATIPQVLIGGVDLRHDRPIIISPFGLGILDIAVGAWVYEEAKKRGALIEIPDFFDNP